MADITVTGLAANDPVPGHYVEVNFGQGPAAGSSGPRNTLLMGNKTTAGSAVVDTVIYGPTSQVPLQTEADAIALFGAGSELHLMFRAFTGVNQDSPLYAIAITESAGTAATATITIANNATGNGNIRFFHGGPGSFVDTGVEANQTPTTMAGNMVANINAATYLPFTAGNVAGVVTLTAKLKGPRGNQIRYQTLITSGIATTVTGGTDSAFSGGATADSNTVALTTIASTEYYTIVSAANDATQFGALKTQVDSQASPTTGIRQYACCGTNDTIANTITLATGINAVRDEIYWQYKSQVLPCELAAKLAGIFRKFEDTGDTPRLNFCGFGNDNASAPYWNLPASRDNTAWPTRTDIKSALNNGITPIGVNTNGTTYLVDRITTRSLSGSVQDYRARDSHKRTVIDFLAKDWVAKVTLQFPGTKIANDPPKGGRVPGPDVVTETIYKGAWFSLLNTYEERDLIENVPATKAGTQVVRGTNPSSRMGLRSGVDVIDIFKQSANQINQVG